MQSPRHRRDDVCGDAGGDCSAKNDNVANGNADNADDVSEFSTTNRQGWIFRCYCVDGKTMTNTGRQTKLSCSLFVGNCGALIWVKASLLLLSLSGEYGNLVCAGVHVWPAVVAAAVVAVVAVETMCPQSLKSTWIDLCSFDVLGPCHQHSRCCCHPSRDVLVENVYLTGNAVKVVSLKSGLRDVCAAVSTA